MRLAERLAALAAGADHGTYRPALFSLADSWDRRKVEELCASGLVREVHDRYVDQLAELCATRSPKQRLRGAALDEAVRAALGDGPTEERGTWVHYPWSGRLVHVLGEAEYRELRFSRNRYKITPDEQRILREKRIGVVGLSVGQACAVTLALEGVGGTLRLADFDELALSNMNRLRAGVHEIGLHKCVIAARAIAEIDPFLRVDVFEAGLTEENAEAFLTEGGKLDLVLEECDDLFTKILLRERARARGIPVLMETNDRGMLDVERFDREPDRPVLHGLLRGLAAAELKGLSAAQKVAIVLRILGPDALRGRLGASLLEVEETTTSWPQLASGTMLGGAVTTDVARRMLLGELTRSGRYYVDLEALVKDGREAPLQVDAALEEAFSRRPLPPPEVPPLARAADKRTVTREDVRRLVGFAVLAPSGGNAQPWRFVAKGGRVRCLVSPDGGRTLNDYKLAASFAALGAAVENMVLAAPAMGLSAEVVFPSGGKDPRLACDVVFRVDEASYAVDPLCAVLGARCTNRKPGTGAPLSDYAAGELAAAAEERKGKLLLVTDRAALDEVGQILGQGDRMLFLSRKHNEEMGAELRWTEEEVLGTRDGLDVLTLDVPPPALAAVRLATTWKAMEFAAKMGGGGSLERSAQRALLSSSAAGLVVFPGTSSRSYFEGGRALERVWLAATSLGLALQPWSSMLYLFARLERGGGKGLEPKVRERLGELRERFSKVFPVPEGNAEVLLFRLSKADPPTARSLRRPVEDVLTFA
ncbi:Rv1355c family protein [Polyangium spumosum]|uniref:Rv1355c family protein n=1 Tax=Polyangium spumosum TaxID=889282 RepID=A0A6N7Q0H0_9BACT|nr:Rv1355c family protein [Polyangium spumosum]MRG96035.1 Rv1355c family protein [Polyangium spumosum]